MNFKDHLLAHTSCNDIQKVLLAAAQASREIYQTLKTQKIVYSQEHNSSGETQLSHDLLADEILMKHLKTSKAVSCFVSEERSSDVCFIEHEPDKLLVAFDPIDGSSVAGAGLAVGTSMGVYRGAKTFLEATGRHQVASIYFLYGPRIICVYSTGKGVHLFALNEVQDVFVLEQEHIQLDDEIKYCGFGNMHKACEVSGFPALIKHWECSGYKLRYSGSMAADINGLLYRGGGIFAYPGEKLRLLYECNPFAFLVEQAGGKAVNMCGQDILDLPIAKIDATSSILIGARKEVEDSVRFLKKACNG